MNKKTIWGIVIIVVIILVAAVSTEKKGTESVKIGVIAPFSGAFASFGEEIKKGVIEESKNTQIQFVFEDDMCEPKSAVSAFQKLVNVDKVNYIIGPGCGSPQEAIVPLLKENQILAVVPSAASNDLFQKSGKMFFNIQYSLENESKFIAEKMFDLGYKKVALVTYGNAFSKTHHDSFVKNFKGEIVADVVLLDNNADLLTDLTKIKRLGADAIYAPDLTYFFSAGVAKAKQIGLNAALFSTYPAEMPVARALVEGVSYSFPDKIVGTEGGVFELARESAKILVQAIAKCGNNVKCSQESLVQSGEFDEYGTSVRGFVLKRIEAGKPMMIE